MKTKLITVLAALLFIGCSTQSMQNDPIREISSEKCAPDSEYPPLFKVVENNQTNVVVELGNFPEFFREYDDLKYKVTFVSSTKSKQSIEETISIDQPVGAKTRIVVPVKKTGVFHFSIYRKESSPVWEQKVFAIASSEHQLSEAEKFELAKKYAPVVSYHDQELYFPVSLPYLFNQVDVDQDLRKEPFLLTNKKVSSFFGFGSKQTLNMSFTMDRLTNILPFYGHSKSVLKSGLESSSDTRLKQRYGQDQATVYYSVFENPKNNEIYINYHFFYSYDPKNGTKDNESIAAHIFDRESMTVVVNMSAKKPLSVFYGAHLPNQILGQMDAAGAPVQKWRTGRVYVPYDWAIKKQGRPMPAIALGSHAVYPIAGNYGVFLNDSPDTTATLLKEPAGGNKFLYPDFMTDFEKNATSYAYKLEDLKLDSVTSDCANPHNMLAFSGSTVDVLGPVNATFPPFTDREEDYFNYADPNAPMFELNKKASD